MTKPIYLTFRTFLHAIISTSRSINERSLLLHFRTSERPSLYLGWSLSARSERLFTSLKMRAVITVGCVLTVFANFVVKSYHADWLPLLYIDREKKRGSNKTFPLGLCPCRTLSTGFTMFFGQPSPMGRSGRHKWAWKSFGMGGPATSIFLYLLSEIQSYRARYLVY